MSAEGKKVRACQSPLLHRQEVGRSYRPESRRSDHGAAATSRDRVAALPHPDELTPAQAQLVAYQVWSELRRRAAEADAHGAGPDIRRVVAAFAGAYERGVETE